MEISLLNYFLGVIYGDGSDNGYELRWVTSDEQWFNSLSELIPKAKLSSYKVTGRDHKRLYLLRCNDEQLLSWMRDRGLALRKSYLQVPMFPDLGYEWYFIQGLFESDGSVFISNRTDNGNFYSAVAISAREPVFSWLKQFLLEDEICSSISETLTTGLKTLTIYYSYSLCIFHKLLYKLPVSLLRKQQKMDLVISLRKDNYRAPEELKQLLTFPKFRDRFLNDVSSFEGKIWCKNIILVMDRIDELKIY